MTWICYIRWLDQKIKNEADAKSDGPLPPKLRRVERLPDIIEQVMAKIRFLQLTDDDLKICVRDILMS